MGGLDRHRLRCLRHRAGHSYLQDGLLVRPPPHLQPSPGDGPTAEMAEAAQDALEAIALRSTRALCQPSPTGLGIEVALSVKGLYGVDPTPTLARFDAP